MRETVKIQAIILNRQAFRENDVRVVLYSEKMGKLELVARGVKKPGSKLAGHLEPITLSDVMIVPGRQYDYVGSATSENCFIGVKNDLDRLCLAGKVIQIFNKVVKSGKADKGIFNLLFDFLNLLNNNSRINNREILFYFFVLKLLSRLGYQPRLYKCVGCGKEISSEAKFSLSCGGMICRNCFGNRGKEDLLPVSSDSLKLLRLTIFKNYNILAGLKVNNKVSQEFNNTISLFLKYYI